MTSPKKVIDKPDRKIKELYVWIASDPKTGLEGIVAYRVGFLQAQAATSDLEVAKKLLPEIMRGPNSDGINYRLVKFSQMDVVDEIKHTEIRPGQTESPD